MDVVLKPAKTDSSLGSFTKDQLNAYNALIKFIDDDYNPNDYKKALIGPAGTGKTYLVRELIKNSNLSYSTIGLSAPTHKACRILKDSIKLSGVKVNTLASDLGFKLNFNIENFNIENPPFDPKGRVKINDFRLYIIDEASMIPKNLMLYLEKVCKSNSCKIIYIGDDAQLPPVNERISPCFHGVTSYKLTEIVRQQEDNPVRYLLDILRYDIKYKTFNFLEYISKNPCRFDDDNILGYSVCNSTTFANLIYNNFSDERITTDVDYVKIIAYTNDRVAYWNNFVRNKIISDCDKSIVTKNDLFISYVTIVNAFNAAILKNSEEYIVKDVINYTHPIYGIKGFLVKFIAIHGGEVTTPLFIVDHKDRASMQAYITRCNELVEIAKKTPVKTRAARWREYYEYKEAVLLLTNIANRQGKLLHSRSIDYGFALTSHKSQGSTFNTVFVDVNDIVFDRFGRPYADAEDINRRLYVACSRCKNKLYLRYGK